MNEFESGLHTLIDKTISSWGGGGGGSAKKRDSSRFAGGAGTIPLFTLGNFPVSVKKIKT
jgi:hypothetical protein